MCVGCIIGGGICVARGGSLVKLAFGLIIVMICWAVMIRNTFDRLFYLE